MLLKLELEKSVQQQNSIIDGHQDRYFDASTEDTKLELDFVKYYRESPFICAGKSLSSSMDGTVHVELLSDSAKILQN